MTGGAGLGRHEGRAAFVPLTAPGDRVRARVTRDRKGFVQAELEEILEAGPGRVDPPCPHFGACGGCDLQHLDAEVQLAAKTDIVTDCFRRLGKLDVGAVLEPASPAGPAYGYRNRIRLTRSDTGLYGLLRRGSNEVVPLERCLQLPEAFNDGILPFLHTLPPVDQIVVRLDGQGGFLASLFGQPNRLRPLKTLLKQLPAGSPPHPGCVGLLFNNLPVWGRDHLILKVADRIFRVHAQSFFQANQAEAAAVAATTRAWIDEARGPDPYPLADLFAGVGLFTLALADRWSTAVSVESDPHAVRDAENNVARDHDARGRAHVVRGRVGPLLESWRERAPAELADFPWRDAVAVLDPPRVGLGPRGVEVLAKLGPRTLVYLSCDPATLARDGAALASAGYVLRRAKVVDMFPQTGHVETLSLWERGD